MRRGELQKYIKSKTPTKPTTTPQWGNRGKKKVDQVGTSKDGGKLNVVSFIQQRKDEKLGKYGKFEERRIERSLKTMSLKGYVNTISRGQFYRERVPIVFSYLDLEKANPPHTNPIIMKLRIRDNLVSRVLVDRGSSSDILFWDAFLRMGIKEEEIWPIKTLLHAFNGAEVKPLGVIVLPIYAVD